jgi:hypothetical protein
MAPSFSKSAGDKNAPVNSGSPLKKNMRKVLSGQKLPFSPKTKVPNLNKVYVVGTQLGIILIRTEKQNSKDDAFTNNAQKMIEDVESGVAHRLSIIKVCSRRQSQLIDKAILQSTNWHSQWFVCITDEVNNTAEFRREHVDKFICFLNEVEWKWPQQFSFVGDETKIVDDKITSTLDTYLLNVDIAAILRQYVFNELSHFLEDEDAIKGCFGAKCTSDQAREYLKDAWVINSTP